MLSIRPASAGDVPVLNALIRELAAFERLPVSVTDASCCATASASGQSFAC